MKMMTYKNKICVITPTIRPEGLKLVEKALDEQTFTDFDWIIGSSFPPKCDWADWVEDKFKGGYWTLNRIYNKLIKATDAPLIVSWQDFTYGDDTILERLWEHYQKNNKSLVSVTGHKYLDDTFALESWFDPRRTNSLFTETSFNNVEWNLCSCPRKALVEIGGFLEDLDFEGFGMDGYCVNQRLNELGYKFFLDNEVKSYSLMHGRVDKWEKNNLIHRWGDIVQKYGDKWLNLNYLKK